MNFDEPLRGRLILVVIQNVTYKGRLKHFFYFCGRTTKRPLWFDHQKTIYFWCYSPKWLSHAWKISSNTHITLHINPMSLLFNKLILEALTIDKLILEALYCTSL